MMEDRNRSKMDVEFYLLNREYNELTPDERAIVNEHVESEQEFNEMKAVVMGAGNFFKEEKELEPNPAIKAALLKEFDKQQPARAYWLNGIFVSLFPKEKKIYQKPGMQLIGLAASVLLIVTIGFKGNADINNSTLAQNEEVKTEEQTIKEVIELDKKEIEVENILLEDDLEAPNAVLQKEVATLNEVEIEEKSETAENKLTTTAFMYDAQPLESVASDLTWSENDQEMDNRTTSNESKDTFRKETSKNKGFEKKRDDKLVISATAPATLEVVEEISVADDEGYFTDDVSEASGGAAIDGNFIDLPLNSRTLAEDADLIGILYTAM